MSDRLTQRLRRLTDAQLQGRLDVLDGMIARADTKDLPALTTAFRALFEEQVRRDLERAEPRYDTLHPEGL